MRLPNLTRPVDASATALRIPGRVTFPVLGALLMLTLASSLATPSEDRDLARALRDVRGQIPAESSMQMEDFDKLARSPTAPTLESLDDQPLTFVLMTFGPAKNDAEREEFDCGEVAPKGRDIATELARSQPRLRLFGGRARGTLVQADRIREVTGDLDGDRLRGVVRVDVPGLFRANARYEAVRSEKGWDIRSFSFPARGIETVKDEATGRWRSRTIAVSATEAEGRSSAPRDDILVADFERADYGDWETTGEAFGPGPARGTLSNQMHVSGFLGERLVNSFYRGDGTTGTLTSPPFQIQRAYITFLIGGGGHEGLAMELIVDDEVVRSASGPNTRSGGSEALELAAWDVRELAGTTARIRIVDQATGGWGHINVDHIVQTDKKPRIPGPRELELEITKRYLLIPVENGARMTRVDVRARDENVREFEVELATSKEKADFWAHLDVSRFAGEKATLRFSRAFEESLDLIAQSDTLPRPERLYDEALRPQFHFSQRIGWNNDPNGMVYYDGEWHLYYQHNPYGWKWGNMHWGHAVSRDLVHWEELPIAIYNKRFGDWAFSGSAIVDERNTAGWQTGDEKVIVAAWTSTGRGECIAYSNDRGRTFTEYEGNPVVKHEGRDPKIIWYEPGEHWVMAVYTVHEGKNAIAFHTSKNLKDWTFASRIDGFYECPEILELPVDGSDDDRRWVIFAADARYVVGRFDGKVFTPLHDGKHRLHYGDYYASQVFSGAPGDRKIQIGWARIEMPGMRFNQTFTFPHELTLRTTPDGVRLFAEPVREIEKLYRRRIAVEERALAPDAPLELAVSGELFDVYARFEIGEASAVGLDVGGNRIVYDARARKLGEAELDPVDGSVSIRVLVDRPMLEVIGNGGRVYITGPRPKRGDLRAIRAFSEGGAARLVELEARELQSIWKR